MPLLKGKSNIGHNIEEMQEHGHPHKQAVAAALHTALDGGTMPEVHATTAMTHAEMNAKNREYYNGSGGNVIEPAGKPLVQAAVDRKAVPVWKGHGEDEQLDGVVSGYRAGRAAGEALAGEGRVPGMDSEENLSEGEPLGDVTDAGIGPEAHFAVKSTAKSGTLLGGVKHSTSSSFVNREHAERLAQTNKEIHEKAGRGGTEHKVIAVKPSKRSIRPEEVGE